jgi:hypothetical protein
MLASLGFMEIPLPFKSRRAADLDGSIHGGLRDLCFATLWSKSTSD